MLIEAKFDAMMETTNFAAVIPNGGVPPIPKAAEILKAANVALDKENVEPVANFDDIEITDASVATTSHIIDLRIYGQTIDFILA